MDPCLKEQLNQTIKVRRPTGYVSGGPDQTLAAAVSIAAYVELRTEVVDFGNGNQRKVTHLVITEDELRADDRVWLPGKDATNLKLGLKPANIEALPDPDTGEISHYEVML